MTCGGYEVDMRLSEEEMKLEEAAARSSNI